MQKNIFKKKLLILTISALLLFTSTIGVYAQTTELIPLGRTTGMKFFSQGAVVVGFSDVNGQKSPGELSGLALGDIIIKANGLNVCTNETLQKAVSQCHDDVVVITALRDGKQVDFNVKTELSENDIPLIGVWVRDSMAGIGTITFVDPKTGQYGALGHGVSDMDTGLLMPIDSGALMESNVIGAVKGKVGAPGELQGEYDLFNNQGTINSNTDSGVYGTLSDDKLYKNSNSLPVASSDEIQTGSAYILSNVDGKQVEKYSIEIIKIYDTENDYKDMMIKVTDDNLLEKTGGIVQGMSGSPIIQNGKFIGAVTHVLVNDPTRGYGIFIESMLKTAQDIE